MSFDGAGSDPIPLVYVEVEVLQWRRRRRQREDAVDVGSIDDDALVAPQLTTACAKQQLRDRTTRSSLLPPSSRENPSCGDLKIILAENFESSSTAAGLDYDRSSPSSFRCYSSGYLFSDRCVNDDDGRLNNDDERSREQPDSRLPVVWLEQEHPLGPRSWPCRCRGFFFDIAGKQERGRDEGAAPAEEIAACVIISDATMVRVVHLGFTAAQSVQASLTGELATLYRQREEDEGAFVGDDDDEVLQNHSETTVRQLALRMKLLMTTKTSTMGTASPTLIGTTSDAFESHRRALQRRSAMRTSLLRLASFRTSKNGSNVNLDLGTNSSIPTTAPGPVVRSLLREGMLIVHSPDHGAGKTLLVRAIARRRLRLDGNRTPRVHVIRPGPLFAKYGIYADVALETTVHEVVLSASIRNIPICILLDQFDAFLPTAMSRPENSSSSTSALTGDAAALPVLNGMTSYLIRLSASLKYRGEVPFPSSKNALYNLNGRNGWVVPVRLCVVAVVTCSDRNDEARSDGSVLHAFPAAGRFRLPALTAETRYLAFLSALNAAGVRTTTSSKDQERLVFLAACAVWARGGCFKEFARRVRMITSLNGDSSRHATSADFEAAVSAIATEHSGMSRMATSAHVEFLQGDSTGTKDLFQSVGGNQEAKVALEDALALDPSRRRVLRSFGMAPPTGIMLFGPPGTGKTLLAKAVARLLRHSQPHSTPSSSSQVLGGAFISLSSTDVARAEVGTGEKMVVSAFESARMNSPSVIFVDEFQALFLERASGSSSRLTTTLLQCMDDVKQWSDIEYNEGSMHGKRGDGDDHQSQETRVVVLAATNTPWMIEKAFLRPGRFDRVVHVGLPDTQDRDSILNVHLRQMRLAASSVNGTRIECVSAICERLAVNTEGFSGADLAALCRAAAVRCLLENEESVREEHFVAALAHDVRPSAGHALVDRIKRWRL